MHNKYKIALTSVAVAGLALLPASAALAVGGQGYVARGDSGAAVVCVQKGVGAPVDGAFGPRTEAAVEQFQADSGL